MFIQVSHAQQIDSVEYFINTDPGFGNGTGISTTHAANISNLTFNVNTTALNKGFNNLFVRSHSSNGHWSVTEHWLFFKDIITATNVTRVEYYVDTDPGFGSGTSVSITPGANIANVFFTVDITVLTKGFHNIFMRSRDDNGNWSITGKWLFFKDIVPAANVNRLEYFIDTDPGFGSGTAVSISAAATIADVFFTVDITGLTNGFHNIFIRSKDNAGNWSITNKWLFYKDIIPAANVSKLEYFVDSDPGFGNGTPVSITPGANISNVSWTVDITGLSNGFHNIFIRSKDNAGNWSITNKWLFFKDILPAANVSKLEYFVDTDPGFGNGTAVSITPGANISDLLIPVNTTALSEGFHKIFLRSRDNNGSWSITNRYGFFKEFVPSPLNVKTGEYFFDTDPGFGNGTVIPFTDPKGNDIADFSFAADISPLLNNAAHYLFVRILDSSNKWSLTNVVSFNKNIVVPVTWLSFNATLENKVVLLNWKTATEANSSHFEIERSINGYQFEKIGTVRAAGNSNTITSYDFTDRLPVKGMNYYRLKQVDLDGSFLYSETRKVEIKTDLPLFAIYNNPSNGKGIVVKSGIVPSLFGVFDITGKKLKEITIVNHTQQIDLSALPSGTYTAALYKDASVIAVEKMIIQH
jgi:hypothetical protein